MPAGGWLCAWRGQRTATGRKVAVPWLLGEPYYSLADIKWYSMAPGLPRLTPELCNEEVAPRTTEWLKRMAERQAVKALENYRAPMPA